MTTRVTRWASNLAVELINKQGIDLMLAQGALGVVPVSQQCETEWNPVHHDDDAVAGMAVPVEGRSRQGIQECLPFLLGR